MATVGLRAVRIAAYSFIIAAVAAGVAFAAASRPNALDHVVDALPAAKLLAQPPALLVDSARAEAANRLESIRAPLWLVMVGLQIFVLSYIWRSGAAARLRDWLRARTNAEFVARFGVGAALTLAAKAAAFAPQYIEYRALRAMTLVNVLSIGYMRTWLLGALVAAAIGGLLVGTILWLADRTHQWYLYTIAAIFLVTLGLAYVNPIVVAPVFAQYTPLPAGASHMLGQTQRSLGTAIPAVEEHISGRTKTGAAYVTGLGSSARIVLSDTILQGLTPDELRFVMLREIALARNHVPSREAIAQALAVIFSIALAILISDRIGFRRDDDEVSRIALLGALLVATSIVVLPFYYAFERHIDREADAYALSSANRAAAVRYLVRRADQDLIVLCPHPLQLWFLTTHEPIGERIAAAQDRAGGCSTVSARPR